MADNVTTLDALTTLDIPCARVVNALQEKEFDSILVIGFEKGAENIYCASHTGDIGKLLLLMERAKNHLLFECAAV